MNKFDTNGCIIYPQPKEFACGKSAFYITPDTVIYYASGIYREAARLLREMIMTKFSLALNVIAYGAGMPENGIYLGSDAESMKPESYSLSVKENCVHILANDRLGAVYGTQTLFQLFAVAAGEQTETVYCPAVEICDWPYKQIRAFHTYMPARESIEGFKRIINALAFLKMNTLIIEVGGGMEYERRPEINRAWEEFCKKIDQYPGGVTAVHHDYGRPLNSTHTELGGGSFLSKREVRDIVGYAKGLGFNVIPEIQSLSHCYYLTMPYREIAEMPEKEFRDTYCPSNPKSYEILFDVADEVLEVFEPDWVCIGHDEIWTLAECPVCRGKTGEELVASDINRLYDFYISRGVRVMQWCGNLHDFVGYDGNRCGGLSMEGKIDIPEMFEVEGGENAGYWRTPETHRAAGMIPKDILMADECWGQGSGAETDHLKNGFKTVFGNFFIRGKMAADWDKRSKTENVLGGLSAAWCLSDDYNIARNNLIYGVMFAANLLWRDDYEDQMWELERTKIIGRMPEMRGILRGSYAPLDGTGKTEFHILYSGNGGGGVTVSLPPEDGNGWMKNSRLPLVFGETSRLSGGTADNVDINVNAGFKSLIFVHAATKSLRHIPTWSPEDMSEYLLGRYEVVFEDGSVESIDVEYGINIGSIDMDWGRNRDDGPNGFSPVYVACEPWEGSLYYFTTPVIGDADGNRKTLFAFEWVNQKSSKAIKTVRVHDTCRDPEQKLLLFAIAGSV